MRLLIALFAVLVAGSPLAAQRADQCTAAVISPGAGAEGRPMLWKNRDTGELSNRVVFVKEQPFSYLALVDKQDPSGRICWAGINDAGFAIMNTASYNLPQRAGEAVDQEGYLMATALRSCRNVADFEAFLKANLGPSLGASTNFGVIDATGQASVFEVHNHGYVRLEAAAAEGKHLLVTNYSRTGQKLEGAGRLRMQRAETLVQQRRPGPFTPREILQSFARDTGHVLLNTPAWPDFGRLQEQQRWLHSKHTINRWDTACAVILVGKDPRDPKSHAVLWVLPGEPLTSVALPLFVDAGASPEAFHLGKEAPLWGETWRLKGLIRPGMGQPERQEYLDTAPLNNPAGTGFLPILLKAEDANLEKTANFLKSPRSSAELATFQKELADQTLQVLKGVAPRP